MTKIENKNDKGEKNKSKKAKSSRKSKQKLKLPGRAISEVFTSLVIERKLPTINEDFFFAADMKKRNCFLTFKKLLMPYERFDSVEYKIAMPDCMNYIIYKPEDKATPNNCYFVYTIYGFIDEFSMIEAFEQKKYYLRSIPFRQNVQLTLDLASCTSFLRYDYDRRREIIQKSYRPKPEYSNYCKKMMTTSRWLIIKQEKCSTPIYGHMIMNEVKAVEQAVVQSMNVIERELKGSYKGTREKLMLFKKNNIDWIKLRLDFSAEPIMLQFPSGKLKDFINDHNINSMRTRNDQDVYNELNYLPSHLAYSAHFCRVLESTAIRRLEDDLVLQKIDSKFPYLRIKPSRYEHKPATTLINLSKDGKLTTVMEDVPKRCPSIESISGFSSDSAASTAFKTPLDWAFNWRLQDKAMDHRYSKSGTFNIPSIEEEAKKYFEHRLLKENSRRRDMIKNVDKHFCFQTNVPFFCKDKNLKRTQFYVDKTIREMDKLGDLFKKRLSEDKNHNLELRLVLGRRFDYLYSTLPTQLRGDEKITLTKGWEVLGDFEECEHLPNVGRFLRKNCSWLENNCWSMSCTVPRCDRITMKDKNTRRKFVLVLILVAICSLALTTMTMLSFY